MIADRKPIWLAGIWLGLQLAVGLLLAVQLQSGLSISANILALLPADSEHPLQQRAFDAVTQRNEQRLLVLVSNADSAAVGQVAATVAAALRDAAAFDSVWHRLNDAPEAADQASTNKLRPDATEPSEHRRPHQGQREQTDPTARPGQQQGDLRQIRSWHPEQRGADKEGYRERDQQEHQRHEDCL